VSFTKTHAQCSGNIDTGLGVSSFIGTCWALVQGVASSTVPTTLTLVVLLIAPLFFKYEN
jgi:hypothetical protein